MVIDDKKFYLPTLDGWRALSILMVLIYHAAWFMHGPDSANHDPALWYYFKIGTYGVSTFFVISGYLITSRILLEFKKYGTFNIKDFYIKRFFRIIPPFYFYLFVLSILNYFLNLGVTTTDFLTSLSFLRIYDHASLDWYTSHIWSLCVEEHFYIILSLYFLAGKTKARYLVVASLIAIFLWNLISFRLKDIPPWDLIRNNLKVISWMDYMFVGCIFAYFSDKLTKLRNIMVRFQLPLFLFLFMLFTFNFPLKTIILPLYIGLLIYLTSLNPHRWMLIILENKLARYLGKISYSLYLWQQLFFVTQTSFNPKMSIVQTFPINIILVFVCAHFSHHFVELPAIRLGRKYLKNSGPSL